mgnify:CR=1 FL=1
MTMRNVIRTPRKEKAWTTIRTDHAGQSLTESQTGTIQVIQDLLLSGLGVTNPRPLTVMRIVGSLQLLFLSDTTAVRGRSKIDWGIAWVQSEISSLSAGDALIPDPADSGIREALWLQRGTLYGSFEDAAGSNNQMPVHPGAHAALDITQMRKSPTADHRLVLIANVFADASVHVALGYTLHSMVAFP